MKDRLGKHDFWNQPIKNPTQNKYTRFLNMPEGELKSKYWHITESPKLKSVYFFGIRVFWIKDRKPLDEVESQHSCCGCVYLSAASVPDWFNCRVDSRGAATQTELHKSCRFTKE